MKKFVFSLTLLLFIILSSNIIVNAESSDYLTLDEGDVFSIRNTDYDKTFEVIPNGNTYSLDYVMFTDVGTVSGMSVGSNLTNSITKISVEKYGKIEIKVVSTTGSLTLRTYSNDTSYTKLNRDVIGRITVTSDETVHFKNPDWNRDLNLRIDPKGNTYTYDAVEFGDRGVAYSFYENCQNNGFGIIGGGEAVIKIKNSSGPVTIQWPVGSVLDFIPYKFISGEVISNLPIKVGGVYEIKNISDKYANINIANAGSLEYEYIEYNKENEFIEGYKYSNYSESEIKPGNTRYIKITRGDEGAFLKWATGTLECNATEKVLYKSKEIKNGDVLEFSNNGLETDKIQLSYNSYDFEITYISFDDKGNIIEKVADNQYSDRNVYNIDIKPAGKVIIKGSIIKHPAEVYWISDNISFTGSLDVSTNQQIDILFNSISVPTKPLTIGDFTDISQNHWAHMYMHWAIGSKVMNGFPDKTFRPDNTITEAEFAAILARYMKNTDKSKLNTNGKGHWAQNYYDELNKWELLFEGYNDDKIKDSPLTRGRLALILASVYGFNLTQEQAVYFMYENDLSNSLIIGSRSYDSFGVDSLLTRAQAVTFLKRIEDKDFKRVSDYPECVIKFKATTSKNGSTGDGVAEISPYGQSYRTDAKSIIGIVGIDLDKTEEVDFNDFYVAALLEDITFNGLETAKIGDKVIVTKMHKITVPINIGRERGRDQYMTYFNYDTLAEGAMFEGSPLNNSIVLYKGIELPDTFTPEEYLHGDDTIFSIEFDGSPDVNYVGRFTDKDSFIALLDNLKFFNASPGQIAKAKEIVQNYGDVEGQSTSLTANSKSFDTSMLIYYGHIQVKIILFKGYKTADIISAQSITVD